MVDSYRVAHVTTVHNPLDPRIYRKEVASLRSAFIETWLIARDTPGREHDPQFLGLSDSKGLTARFRRQIQAFHHLRSLKPEVVHIHDPELIPLAFLAKKLTRCKVVYDMHEDYLGRNRRGGRLLRGLEKWCFRWVDHVVLAETSYESILRGRPTPSTTLLNYVLPTNGASASRTDDALTLIYAGTVSNCRGLSNMLGLAAEIKRQRLDWRIEIVGVSYLTAERQGAEERIRREGLGSIVTKVGWDRYVPWSRIVERYSESHLGLALFEPLPNHSESILSKFYEYIYFGLPVIHSDFPLWTAFFEGNGCGVPVKADEPAEVVRVIKRLLDTGDLREMQRRSIDVRDEYVWSKMEPRLIGLYGELRTLRSSVGAQVHAQTRATE